MDRYREGQTITETLTTGGEHGSGIGDSARDEALHRSELIPREFKRWTIKSRGLIGRRNSIGIFIQSFSRSFTRRGHDDGTALLPATLKALIHVEHLGTDSWTRLLCPSDTGGLEHFPLANCSGANGGKSG